MMAFKPWRYFCAFCLLSACVKPATVSGNNDESAFEDRAIGFILDNSGKRIGRVSVIQGRDVVVMKIRAGSLPSGELGVHIHETGSCADVGTFKLAGGHHRRSAKPHGPLHPKGGHEGDLPNLHVLAGGAARADYFLTRLTVAELKDTDGAALVIHETRDDYQSQPIGGAGKRIACAVFQ